MYLYPSANNMLNSFFFLEETVQNAAWILYLETDDLSNQPKFVKNNME
jgi:hypothetical protein